MQQQHLSCAQISWQSVGQRHASCVMPLPLPLLLLLLLVVATTAGDQQQYQNYHCPTGKSCGTLERATFSTLKCGNRRTSTMSVLLQCSAESVLLQKVKKKFKKNKTQLHATTSLPTRIVTNNAVSVRTIDVRQIKNLLL